MDVDDWTEREFTQMVIHLAQVRGWMVHHDRPALNKRGRWATWTEGTNGFPDLLLAHPDGRVIAAELKVGRNKPTKLQEDWLAALNSAGVESYVWRPRDWNRIQVLLTVI